MSDFDDARKAADDATAAHKDAHECLKAVGSGERSRMGLTPDSVKALPEWRAAYAAERAAFARLQAANAHLVRNFQRELRAARNARRHAED